MRAPPAGRSAATWRGTAAATGRAPCVAWRREKWWGVGVVFMWRICECVCFFLKRLFLFFKTTFTSCFGFCEDWMNF